MKIPPPSKKARFKIRYVSFPQGASAAVLGHGEYSDVSDIAFTEITDDATRRMKFLLLWIYMPVIIYCIHFLYFFLCIYLYFSRCSFFSFLMLIFNSSSSSNTSIYVFDILNMYFFGKIIKNNIQKFLLSCFT